METSPGVQESWCYEGANCPRRPFRSLVEIRGACPGPFVGILYSLCAAFLCVSPVPSWSGAVTFPLISSRVLVESGTPLHVDPLWLDPCYVTVPESRKTQILIPELNSLLLQYFFDRQIFPPFLHNSCCVVVVKKHLIPVHCDVFFPRRADNPLFSCVFQKTDDHWSQGALSVISALCAQFNLKFFPRSPPSSD